MPYSVAINKKFRYIKAYTLVKKVNDQSNAISRTLQGLINKYLLKSGEKGA